MVFIHTHNLFDCGEATGDAIDIDQIDESNSRNIFLDVTVKLGEIAMIIGWIPIGGVVTNLDSIFQGEVQLPR